MSEQYARITTLNNMIWSMTSYYSRISHGSRHNWKSFTTCICITSAPKYAVTIIRFLYSKEIVIIAQILSYNMYKGVTLRHPRKIKTPLRNFGESLRVGGHCEWLGISLFHHSVYIIMCVKTILSIFS